jgi:hypothetical protein
MASQGKWKDMSRELVIIASVQIHARRGYLMSAVVVSRIREWEVAGRSHLQKASLPIHQTSF